MTRTPPAARQLITEVLAADPGVEHTPTGDPDGYGVHRSIRFTKSDWLADALDAVDDERIADVHRENQASTLVTFVGDIRADQVTPYDIDAVYEGLASVTDDEDDEPEQTPPEPDEE